jgi:hypothetical protein
LLKGVVQQAVVDAGGNEGIGGGHRLRHSPFMDGKFY